MARGMWGGDLRGVGSLRLKQGLRLLMHICRMAPMKTQPGRPSRGQARKQAGTGTGAQGPRRHGEPTPEAATWCEPRGLGPSVPSQHRCGDVSPSALCCWLKPAPTAERTSPFSSWCLGLQTSVLLEQGQVRHGRSMHLAVGNGQETLLSSRGPGPASPKNSSSECARQTRFGWMEEMCGPSGMGHSFPD